ncbi:MAG: FAD-dependent monooxygenase [Planctomycetes bacterium]|nr:FAD-dependent monooxygenase [Planctomycetota bacterium]
MTYDVVVVGGSVAGAVTARELGRRGLRVALVEKARFPRLKPCGEGLLPHGAAALVGMGLRYPGEPVRGLRFVSPSGIVAQADFPWGRGMVVRRDRFDEFLLRSVGPNVDVFEGTSYDPRRFPARWIVGADGVRSQFHRRPEFRARPPRHVRVGLSTHVRGLRIDRERVEVVLFEGGEIYLGPSHGDEALVACLYWKEALPRGASGEERVRKTLEVRLPGRVGRLEFTSPCLALAPLGLAVNGVARDPVVLVGDAAGTLDPLTGEGMSLAILSARAAADAIASGDLRGYPPRRKALAAGAEWLSRWMLRAARRPKVADRVVAALADRPALFARLLDIATGGRVSYVALARLVL